MNRHIWDDVDTPEFYTQFNEGRMILSKDSEMLDYEYTPEPAPGDLSTERVARKAANGMAKAFGVFASSMAVACSSETC